jgi:flagellar protein FlaG
MGAETSSTHLIFFITAIVIAGSVVAVIYTNVNAITSSSGEGAAALSQQLKTDIKIINDPANIPNVGNSYTFYVKNTGRSNLASKFVSVLINGEVIPDSNVTKVIVGGDTEWMPADVLQLDVTTDTIRSGDNSIKIISENGVDDTLEFTR